MSPEQALDLLKHRQHTEAGHRESVERRLTELDADWRERFIDYREAERFYWRELQSVVTGNSPYQPPDVTQGHREDWNDE